MTPQDVENRKEFCKALEETFKPYFSEFKVNLFGSSINNLGFKGCDADVSIQIESRENEVCLKQVTYFKNIYLFMCIHYLFIMIFKI